MFDTGSTQWWLFHCFALVSKTNHSHHSSTLLIFHDWKRLPTPIFSRPTCVLLKGKNESLPSSSLAPVLRLAFTKQQQTDRKRVFGCEFMEPAELNKALREISASLSGVKTRFRSKPRSLRTPKPTGLPQTCGSRAIFPRLASQISMSGVCTNLFFRGPPRARLLVRSCSERTVAPELLWSFSDRYVSLATVSKKGEAKKTYEVVCQLWRRDAVATPTLHSVISPPRCGSALRSVFPKQSKGNSV